MNSHAVTEDDKTGKAKYFPSFSIAVLTLENNITHKIEKKNNFNDYIFNSNN